MSKSKRGRKPQIVKTDKYIDGTIYRNCKKILNTGNRPLYTYWGKSNYFFSIKPNVDLAELKEKSTEIVKNIIKKY